MSDSTPTQIRLDHYPTGIPGDDAWTVTHDPTPSLAEGQIEVDVQLISIDPGMKGWITPMRSYMPPIEPGDVMRSFSIGPVTRTASERFDVGDVVTGFLGVQTTAVIDARAVRPCDVSVAPMELHLGLLGMTGFTGYFGMLDIGRPEASHTVVVSAASGAVGSVAAQVAKRSGARVVGIAGGPAKCAYLVDELGLDAAVDYKSTERRSPINSPQRLRTASTCTSTTSAARSSKPCCSASTTTLGSCCAAASRATTTWPALRGQRGT